MYNGYGALSITQFIVVVLVSSLIYNYIHLNTNFDFKKLIINKSVKNFIQLIFLIAISILLIYLYAYRTIDYHHGGLDANSYKTFFEGNLSKEHFEIGFKILVKIVRLITNNYSMFLIVCSIIMLYCFFKFIYQIKASKYNYLLIITIISLFFESFNILRTVLAIFISLLIYKELNENKFFKSFLLAIICTSLHISSIILFPIIFANLLFKNKEKIKLASLIFLIIIMCLFTYFGCVLVGNYLLYTDYKSYVNSGQLVVFIYLFLAVVFALSIKNYNKLINYNSINRIFIISISLSFIVFFAQLKMVILYRMIEFFLPIAYALLVQLLHINKSLITRLIILSMLIYKIVTFFIHCSSLGILFY